MADRESLHCKYEVRRVKDPSGRHGECEYFVLDLSHDRAARLAALVYADESGDPELRDELVGLVGRIQRRLGEGDEAPVGVPEVASVDRLDEYINRYQTDRVGDETLGEYITARYHVMHPGQLELVKAKYFGAGQDGETCSD